MGNLPTPPRRNTASASASAPPPMSPILENGTDRIPQYGQSARPLNALEEKALLKQKYEQEEATASLRAGSSSNSHWADPPPPIDSLPPPADTSIRSLSAAEEKDRLRARYDAVDRAAAGLSSSDAGPPPPSFDSHQLPAPNPAPSWIPDGMPQYVSPLSQFQSSSDDYANDSPQSR